MEMICTICSTAGIPKTIVKGSLGIEILLWICGGLPGLIYSAWRMSTKSKGCRTCGASNMIPINSPQGRKLAR